jgi:hypothetical protein
MRAIEHRTNHATIAVAEEREDQMPEERVRNTSMVDGARTDSARTKPVYEKPCMVQLGELAGGQGENCLSGNAANPACIIGSSNYSCYPGASASFNCIAGTGGA